MDKKSLILIFLLLFTIPFGETHRYFHTVELRERNWFLLGSIKQDVEWYIKDTTEAITWVIVLFVWYIREKKCEPLFASFVLLFLIYRVVDLIMYWVDFRQSENLYTLCYLFLVIAVCINYSKEKFKPHN